MEETKKERSPAQRAADKRYKEKNPNRERLLPFQFAKEEADSIDDIIRQSGLSKADFLRRAVELYKQGKF